MSLRNCTRCGRVYKSTGQELCQECLDADEDEFNCVRNFIKEHPKVSLEVVSEATGVDEDRIREYLRQGRLETANLDGPVLECRRCGKPIYQGEYCILCREEIYRTFDPSSGSSESAGKSSEPSRPASFLKRYRNRR